MTPKKSIIQVSSISEEKLSSDERNFRKVGFKQIEDIVELPNGKKVPVHSNQPVRYRNLFEKGPKNGTDEDGNPRYSAGDALYPKLEEGLVVYGSIDTIETEPYVINNTIRDGDVNTPGYDKEQDRIVTSLTVITFDSETLSKNVMGRKDSYNNSILLKGHSLSEVPGAPKNQPEEVAQAHIADDSSYSVQ